MEKNITNKEIITYQSKDGEISFNVNVFEETVWLTQKQMAELFGRDRKTITRHIINIFKEGELQESLVCSYFEHTATDGKKYKTQYYNLDVIISVGYRVKSKRGVQFRQWAMQIIKSYLMTGYAINEHRIKNLEDNYNELSKELKADIKNIHQALIRIANRPITINNQIGIGSENLESKVIELLDEIIKQIKADKALKNQLEQTKSDIKTSTQDKKARNRIAKFFNDMGDNDSNLYKTIKGAGVTKKVITELIKLWEKLKDTMF